MRLVALASLVFLLSLTYAMTSTISGGAPIIHANQAAAPPADRGQPARRDGQAIFRFDTFGDEQLWTDFLRMHEVLATLDPATALAVGLKIDVDALPRQVIAAVRAGHVDLTDPA